MHILILKRNIKSQYWIRSHHFNLSILNTTTMTVVGRVNTDNISDCIGHLQTIQISNSIIKGTKCTFRNFNGLLSPNIG